MNKFKFIFLAIISGLIFWLSFNYHFLWFFCFIAFFPLLHIIYSYNLKHYQNFLAGFISGSIMVAGIIWWHWEILPLDWAGVGSQTYGVLLIFYVWVLSSLMGGLVGLFTLSLGYLKRNNWSDFLLVPTLWVIAEFIRSVATSILWYGDGGALGPHWSIAFAGYTLASSKILISFASLGGVYLLNFIVVLINIIIYFVLRDYFAKNNLANYLKLIASLLGIIIVFNIYYNFANKPGEIILVAVATTYQESFSTLPSEDIPTVIESRKSLLSQIKKDNKNPAVVIFPEDSRLIAGIQFLGQQSFIQEIFGNKEVLIVDSARISREKGKPVALTFYFLNTLTGSLSYSEKQFLAPHGEYMPIISNFILKLFGRNDWVEGFNSARGFSKGQTISTVNFKNFKVGALACSESMSIVFNRNLVDKNSAFIINTASHSLFNGSKILYDQTLNMGKIRAVENNRYYIQSGNFVPSFIIDNTGKLINESIWSKESIIYGEVENITRPSFYNKIGRFLMPIILLFILLISILGRFDYSRKKD